MIICQTPFRISFFGGGTDFPQWYENNSGSVISASINKFTYITARDLPNFFEFKYRLRYFKTEEVKELSKINHPTFREIINKFTLTFDTNFIYSYLIIFIIPFLIGLYKVIQVEND